MSKLGIDKFSSGGNLTMGQVLAMFQNQVKLAIVKKHNPGVAAALDEVDDEAFAAAFEAETTFPIEPVHAGSAIEEKFGKICLYYSGDGATNESLKNHIRNFVDAYGPNQKITLLLNKVSGDELALEEQVFANAAHLSASTHWTVLSLAKDDEGKLVISYADSLVAGDAAHRMPKKVQLALTEVFTEKDVEHEFEAFESSMQTGADCGYYAVWHALRMRGLPVEADPKKFVEEQRKILSRQGGIEDEDAGNPFMPMGKLTHGRSRNFSKLRRGKTAERDADDSSDDEEVVKSVHGYDLQYAWGKFCLEGNKGTASKSFSGLSTDEQEELETPFMLHAFGIGLLYSDEVGLRYYGRERFPGLKERYLLDERKVGGSKAVIQRNLPRIVKSVVDLFVVDPSKELRAELVEAVAAKLKDSSEDIKGLIKIAAETLAQGIRAKISGAGEVSVLDNAKKIEKMAARTRSCVREW